MAKSTLGNNAQPVRFLTEYEVEVDDDYENMDGELVEEQEIFGYRAICPNNSGSTTVTIFFYYYAPTSSWFWDYIYALDYEPIIPVVFACDSNWNLTECLNQSFTTTTLSGRANGWVQLNVTLKRKLVKNERIVFGVYSDLLGVASSKSDWNSEGGTNCYSYFSQTRRSNYNSAIAYISSSEFIQKASCSYSDWEVCLYLEYVNEAIAYTRSVLGNVSAASSNSRKNICKRSLTNSGCFTSTLTKKNSYKKNCKSTGALTSSDSRKLRIARSFQAGENVSDSQTRKQTLLRLLENTGAITSVLSKRSSYKKACSSAEALSDAEARKLYMTKIFLSEEKLADLQTRKQTLFKVLENIGDVAASLSKKGSYKKSCNASSTFTDDESRKLFVFRSVQDKEKRSDILSRKLSIFRAVENIGTVNDLSQRHNYKRITASDDVSFLDSIKHLLLIIRSCFSGSGFSDSTTKKSNYKKEIISIVDDSELVIRWGDNFRSFEDSATIDALPFASRIFYRAATSVLGIWDWLRGKIREANNVASFYCPIWTEIEMECRI